MKKQIIILHGWGLKGDIYQELTNLLRREGFDVFAPDLPGFGKEKLKSQNMSLDDYVEFVRFFVKKIYPSKVIFIGHSFGGRVAIKYAWKYPKEVEKIILTGVPIIRSRSFLKKIYYYLAISGGFIFKKFPVNMKESLRKILYYFIGEWDYYKAGEKQQVFKNIIEDDLLKYIKEIKIPIFLVWGKDDNIIPLSNIKPIESIINTKIVIVNNCGHKLPYENPTGFLNVVKKFL